MLEKEVTSDEAIRTLVWREASMSIDALQPGDIVTGFETVEELDIFADNIGRFLRGHRPTLVSPYTHLTHSGRHNYVGWMNNSKQPSQVMRPKGFIGQFKDIRAVMLDDEWINDPIRNRAVFPRKGFVILADMYSTGRGKIGQVVKQCTIGSGVWNDSYNETVRPHLTTATYRNLPSHSADKAVEALLGDSKQKSYERVSQGLRRVILAGLPELGKYR